MPTPPHYPKDALRLDGDDLFSWARMITQLAQMHQELKIYGRAALVARGLDPSEYTITNEGYILTQDQAARIADHEASEASPDPLSPPAAATRRNGPLPRR